MAKNQNNLIKYVNNFFNDLELYDDYKNGHNYKDLLHASIIRFLEYESTYTAYEIYENFFMIYQSTNEDISEDINNKNKLNIKSNTLLELVNVMKNYEETTGDLVETQRDHFIHSVNVFILGLAIYSNNKKYQDAFKGYVKNSPYDNYYKTENGKFSSEEFLYRWGITSLLHDIGYPVEIIGKQLSKFINDSSKFISYYEDINTTIKFNNFDKLNSIMKLDPKFPISYRNNYPETNFIDLYKPTDIIAHQIFTDLFIPHNNKDFDDLSSLYELMDNLDDFVNYMSENNFIDHGFFSAIFVLNSYGALMQECYLHNSNDRSKYDYFFYPILNSATSILLHNYYKGTLTKKDGNFKLGKLKPNQNPLAFLLILCDELQEWNRKPMGIKDKDKTHVNDIEINITKDKLTVNYILKNKVLDPNFSENKEKSIKQILDIKLIFENRMKVTVNIDKDNKNPLDDIRIVKNEIHPILLRNIEEIARSSHARYNEIEKKKGNEITPYDKLDAKLKLSSVRQVKSMSKNLNLIGCELVPKDDSRKKHIFTEDEINYLAKLEHEDWMNEKINTGWISHKEAFEKKLINNEQYTILNETNKEGSTDNKKNKFIDADKKLYVHANLIPFEELNSNSKEKDKRPIREFPELLANIPNNPLKVVDTKLKLLTIKMHDIYKEYMPDNGEIPEFNNLPFELQYNNFKQTHLIIRLLSELNFAVVDIDDKREEIESFKDEEVEYLAENDYNTWYLRKLSEKNESDKSDYEENPRLNYWDDLDFELKKQNKNTFEKLPECLKNVNLKIVKK